MQEHVFESRSEQKNNSQFQDSVDQLKMYASTNFKKEIKKLMCLFDDLELPIIQPPNIPTPTIIKEEDGTTNEVPVNKYVEKIYDEKLKQWMRAEESMEATITSLYNITWGQCSQLLRNKIMASTDYK